MAGTIVTTKNCGGIAYDNQGTIRNCHFCGEIKRLAGIAGTDMPLKRRIGALIFKNSGNGQIDHCSATGVLTNTGNQGVVNKNPLYAFSNKSKVTNCIWINEQNATADEVKQPTCPNCGKDALTRLRCTAAFSRLAQWRT